MDISQFIFPGSPTMPDYLGGLLSSSCGVLEVDATGKVALEIRKPNTKSYEEALALFEKVQVAFGGIGNVYEDIETVAGRGLFVANNDDAIVMMREIDSGSRKADMKRIVKWWDAGKPQGAPLKALMKKVNDPLKPAVLQSKLDGDESCACCKAKRGEGTTLKQCSGCRIHVYCSKECQVSDWQSHKALCKATRELAKNKFDVNAALRACFN